ncbi:MAG: hypothetical protein LBN29_04015 [Mediterranea sp.]|jgi:hypothetical protein|nr:hypothetical protein [Mediterranea sp.]
MKKMVCLIIMLMFPVSVCLAADWVYVASGADGSDVYVDLSSIKSDGTICRAWIKSVYKNLKETKDKKGVRNFMARNVSLFYIDMENKRIQVTHVANYDKDENLIVAVSGKLDEDRWKYVVPESVMDNVFDFIQEYVSVLE